MSLKSDIQYQVVPDEIKMGRCIAYSREAPTSERVNEDAWLVRQLGDNSAVLAVADGAGGYVGGEIAAQMMMAVLDAHLGKANDITNLRGEILTAIEVCNARLLSEGKGSATTLVVAELQGQTVRHYLVGDSSICLIGQRGKIKLQSVPQSLVGYGVEAGLLPEDAALEHEDRHIVLNLVGSADMRVEVGTPISLKPRDTLMLCSDGLTDNLAAADINHWIRAGDMQKNLLQLTQTARENMLSDIGHPDDLTVLLYRKNRG